MLESDTGNTLILLTVQSDHLTALRRTSLRSHAVYRLPLLGGASRVFVALACSLPLSRFPESALSGSGAYGRVFVIYGAQVLTSYVTIYTQGERWPIDRTRSRLDTPFLVLPKRAGNVITQYSRIFRQ